MGLDRTKRDGLRVNVDVDGEFSFSGGKVNRDLLFLFIDVVIIEHIGVDIRLFAPNYLSVRFA